MKRTVLRMIDEAAEKWASRPYALKKTDRGYEAFSFAEVRGSARDFAAWLSGNGFRQGDNLAILAEGSPEWLIAECGILYARCVSVPLSIKLLLDEIPFRLVHSGAREILTSKNQFEKVVGALLLLESKDIGLIYLDEDLAWAQQTAETLGFAPTRIVGFAAAREAGKAALRDPGSGMEARLAALSSAAEENEVITICYTSGTTGNPKGIMLTHLNYWCNCHDGVRLFDLPENLKMLVILPVDHSFAHTAGLYSSLLIGGALYFVDARGGGIATLRNIPINLLEAQPSVLMTVPALSGNFMRKIVSGIEEVGGIAAKLFRAGIAAGVAWNGDGYRPPPIATRIRAAFPLPLPA